MKSDPNLTAVLESWAEAHGLPGGTGGRLLEACPWLDGNETVSTALAPQLFEDVLPLQGLGHEALNSLCGVYNDYVNRDHLASWPSRDVAYAAMRVALAGHGEDWKELFWIHEDSLGSDEPWIYVRDPALLSEPLIQQVARAASCSPYFSAVTFSLDEFGDKIRTVSLRRNDA